MIFKIFLHTFKFILNLSLSFSFMRMRMQAHTHTGYTKWELASASQAPIYPIIMNWQLTSCDEESASYFIEPCTDKRHTTHQEKSSYEAGGDSQHNERCPEAPVHCAIGKKKVEGNAE